MGVAKKHFPCTHGKFSERGGAVIRQKELGEYIAGVAEVSFRQDERKRAGTPGERDPNDSAGAKRRGLSEGHVSPGWLTAPFETMPE